LQLSSNSLSSSNIELNLRISIKQNKQILLLVVVNLALEESNFLDFRNMFEGYICKQVGLVFHDKYILAYKSFLENDAGTFLANKELFQEFLKDYQTMIAAKKKVIIIVIFKESKKYN